jgi:hypothetical protein
LKYILEVDPLDLGPDVRAIGLELVEPGEEREPARGREAAQAWDKILRGAANGERLVLDFFSHLDDVREYCAAHGVAIREAAARCAVIAVEKGTRLAELFERFEGETFGARAGTLADVADEHLEGELSRRGVDAYHAAFPRYSFCAVCSLEEASVTLLSESLRVTELIRRMRAGVADADVDVRLTE